MNANYRRTGRNSTFEKDLESAEDIQALGDRISQPIGIGARRGELDAVSVAIKEQSDGEDNGFGTAFQSVVKDESDAEAVVQRALNTIAIAYDRGDLDAVRVNIIELCKSEHD